VLSVDVSTGVDLDASSGATLVVNLRTLLAPLLVPLYVYPCLRQGAEAVVPTSLKIRAYKAAAFIVSECSTAVVDALRSHLYTPSKDKERVFADHCWCCCRQRQLLLRLCVHLIRGRLLLDGGGCSICWFLWYLKYRQLRVSPKAKRK